MNDAYRIADGEMRYFGRRWQRFDYAWLSNPANGHETPLVHWSRVPDFDARQGDIKWIWEPSRFDWVYQLARGWVASRDSALVETFWRLFDDWREKNPPNTGANWKCGQESSFRLIALVFAAGVFADAAPERLSRLWEAVTRLARRIEVSVGYAVSQQNNHALSEAAALFLAGHALPESPETRRWKDVGRRVMESQVLRQFYIDGSYLQHSNNYTRVALRDVLVFLLTARWAQVDISPAVAQRARAAVNLLMAMIEPSSGRVPNYGSNDGANILALNGADYLDYRPLLQTLSVLLDGHRVFPSGSWDEELAWFLPGVEASLKLIEPISLAANEGGYYVMRGEDSFGLVRCHMFRSRPAHADTLALDLWVRGVNVLPDAGTYQYYDERNLGSFFKSTAAHNTVEVDGASQMVEGSRFLWLDWVKARLLSFSANGDQFIGEHDGYRSRFGVVHRRRIDRLKDRWIIADDLSFDGKTDHQCVLRWRLINGDWQQTPRGVASVSLGVAIDIDASATIELLSGREHEPETALSETYGDLRPCLMLRATTRSDKSVRFVTTIRIGVPGEVPIL